MKLLNEKVIEFDLFDEQNIHGFIDPSNPSRRYCLVCNPVTARRETDTRQRLLDLTEAGLRAIANYQKALPLRPDDPNIRFNLGTALFNKGDYQQAAASYREAVRLKPDIAHAHYNLGTSLLRLNDTKAAQAEFAEAQRLDPSLNSPIGKK